MDKNKAKKEAREISHKEQKIEEQVLKSLDDGASCPDERFQLLLRKHVEGERIRKKLQQDLKTQEKQLESVLREKENLQREHNKNLLMRDKVQEVCREQQKLIKSVKNESMAKIREEEERRKENQVKFQSSLNEITQALNKNNDENLKLRDHNIEITKKLKYLAEQYQMREQQLEKLNEQVKLESQLNQAKLNKVQVESAMEKEILIKEKQIAIEKLLHSQKLLKELTEREIQLKEQLNIYTAKYDDFQSSLQKSNDIFVTYKQEIDKMTKNTKKLEKEAVEWKLKWERNNATLIELATEKKERDDHAIRCNKQVEQLQKLLRALQHERSLLYKLMRTHQIEIPALPPLPPEPEQMPQMPINSEKEKMDKMTKSCAELKQTLAHLQNQMKLFNISKEEENNQTNKIQTEANANKLAKNKAKNKKHKSKAQKANILVANQNGNADVPLGTTINTETKAEDNATKEAIVSINDTVVENDCSMSAESEETTNSILPEELTKEIDSSDATFAENIENAPV